MAVPPALKTVSLLKEFIADQKNTDDKIVSLLKELIAEQKNTVKAINDQTNDDPIRHFRGHPT